MAEGTENSGVLPRQTQERQAVVAAQQERIDQLLNQRMSYKVLQGEKYEVVSGLFRKKSVDEVADFMFNMAKSVDLKTPVEQLSYEQRQMRSFYDIAKEISKEIPGVLTILATIVANRKGTHTAE